jgi:hypothetical protein
MQGIGRMNDLYEGSLKGTALFCRPRAAQNGFFIEYILSGGFDYRRCPSHWPDSTTPAKDSVSFRHRFPPCFASRSPTATLIAGIVLLELGCDLKHLLRRDLADDVAMNHAVRFE